MSDAGVYEVALEACEGTVGVETEGIGVETEADDTVLEDDELFGFLFRGADIISPPQIHSHQAWSNYASRH